ncbi:MAG: hypothetical protein LBF22_02910, partial [Deltaproteobacteria bacterium]|nr:hypothetical protein [Deltaproteobacteria bacterium]
VAPYELEPGSGIFYLNVLQTINAYPDLSTKKILRPFFKKEKFKELIFIYDHFPPWLPEVLTSLGLCWKCQKLPDGVQTWVYPDKNPRPKVHLTLIK